MMDSKSHRRWICGQAAIVVVCSISVWLPGLAAQTSRDPVVVATQSTERSDVKTAKVTIDARQLPLKAVLVDIARQAKLNAVYGDAVSANRTLVTLRMTNVSAEQAFEQALAGTGIVARILPGNDVLFIPSAADTLPERHDKKTGSVKGRILDSITGQGIGNAVISVVGRSQKSTSAPDGHFTISDLSVGSVTLEIKMFGYKMVHRVVAVNGDNIATVDVMLSAISTMLSGVVTTATGSQRKLEVGSSIVSLNVDSIMQTAPIQSVTDLLESRVPGMILQRTSGTPGDPARIRLRGAGSITQNNDPIIVVDGMRMYSEQSEARNVNRETQRGGIQTGNVYTAPSPLDQIDPHSIETIEILKGPSAAAMYGSDAANGVIIITTKRGRAGAPQWYATATMGRTSMPGRWPEALWKWTTPIGGGAPVLCVGFCGDAVVDSSIWFSALNHKPLTVLGTGYTSDVSTSISGGRSNMTYALTLSGSNDDGVLKLPDVEERRFLRFHGRPAPGWMRNPDHLQSWSGAVNIGVEVTPAVQMRVMSSLNQMIQRKTSMASSSETAIAELERTWVDMSQLTETPILGNPYERVRSSTVTVRNSMDVNISPKPTLPVRVQIGTATLYRSDEIQLPRGLLLNTADSVGRWSGSTKSSSELTGLSSTEIPLHRRVALIMGMNYVQSRTDDQSGYFRDVPAGVADPSVGADNAGSRFQRTTSDRRSFGWFLEPRLRVSSRFFAMPGFRLDNNGLSGRNAGLNRLPKINLSWIVSEEPFFRNSNVVNLLRLRTPF